jgi:hypothetical protein
MIDARVPVEEQEVEQVAAPVEKNEAVVLSISGILNDLENGLDREKIGEKYGLEKWEVNELFKHPKLKNRKAKKVKKVSFTLVDDTETEGVVLETLND